MAIASGAEIQVWIGYQVSPDNVSLEFLQFHLQEGRIGLSHRETSESYMFTGRHRILPGIHLTHAEGILV